ncbi:MAG: hypothetical protein GC136_10950 [Alphaproteobacteria bacterium]|nr:hypothetical protein [Alphaproteobacteria bacterium]
MNFLFDKQPVTLLMADDGLKIYGLQDDKTRCLETIAWSDPRFDEKFSQNLVAKLKATQVTMISDSIEQHYRKERILNVDIMNRGAIVQRKLASVFSAYPIRGAIKLKDKAKSRRGEEGGGIGSSTYLLAAIPENQAYAKTLKMIEKTYLGVRNLGLLPVESVSLVDTLAKKIAKDKQFEEETGWSIFIGQHTSGGLRQIVTKNGELALTRITPIVDSDLDAQLWASEVYQEFEATLGYLSRFGYTPQDPTDLIIMCGTETGRILEEMLGGQYERLTCLSAERAAHLLALPKPVDSEARYADPLHAAWAAKSMPALSLMPRSLKEIALPRKGARYGVFALAGLIVLLLGMLGLKTLSYLASEKDLAVKKTALASIESSYSQEVERRAGLGIDIGFVNGTVAIWDKIKDDGIDPVYFVRAIGSVLPADATVTEIYFKTQGGAPTSGGGSSGGTPQVQAYSDVAGNPDIMFIIEFTTNLDPQTGNEKLGKITEELGKILPAYNVVLSKSLADLSFTGGFVNEGTAGSSGFERSSAGNKGEITIRKKVNDRAVGTR